MQVIIFIVVIILIVVAARSSSKSQAKRKETDAIEQAILNKEIELEKREAFIKKREDNMAKLDSVIRKRKDEIDVLKVETERLTSEIKGLYDESLLEVYPSSIIPNIEESSSAEIKNDLSMLKIEEKEIVSKNAVHCPISLNVREKNNLTKKMLLPLDSEITGLLNKLTISNIDSTRNRIVKIFDKINRLYKDSDAYLTNDFLKLKLRELELNYSFIVKVNDEKEQQKAIKEQMIEEEKVQREIDREKKRIEKEEKQFSSEITKLMSYLHKAANDVEKNLYSEKIKELEEKLKELEKVKEDVLQREMNTRAGYVYVISNIGSFGDDVYKIGMTRRLEPMDRIKELSSASVPFEFDVHAMIFSDDAPALETQLHTHFRPCEVNKVNSRKEFFKVSLDEIEKVVLENYNGTVTFTKIALAEQYRRSLELSQEDLAV